MEAALEAGALDVEVPENPADEGATFTVLTEPTLFLQVKDHLERMKFTIEEAQIALIPQTRVEVRGDSAKHNINLVEALEELDDVQKVYANFDIPDEEVAKLHS